MMERTNGHRHSPHDWLSIDRFTTIHEESLRRLESYAIVEEHLRTLYSHGRLNIRGYLLCCGNIELHVDNLYMRNSRDEIRGVTYKYQAQLSGFPVRPIFRYDNAHRYTREGHPDGFHKHIWNYQTWQEIEPPQWIGLYHWPTLAQVVEEVWDWWQVIGQYLDD